MTPQRDYDPTDEPVITGWFIAWVRRSGATMRHAPLDRVLWDTLATPLPSQTWRDVVKSIPDIVIEENQP